MLRRQPLPRLWLMTDERQGDRLWDALALLPRGSGVVFRHYAMDPPARRALFFQVKRVARRRGLLLIVAGAQPLNGDGRHGCGSSKLQTAPAHDLKQVRAAERAGASLIFLSPLYPTRSHPGGRTLGRVRFGLIAHQARAKVIALGGVDRVRARSLAALGAYGWAAIDAWSEPKRR